MMITKLKTGSLVGICLVTTTLGCGESSSESSHYELVCDGSDEPRLLLQYDYAPMLHPGIDLHFENGYGFLVVDGQCRYWATQRPWSPVRTGTLDRQRLDNVAKVLRIEEWPQVAGTYCSVASDQMGAKWMKARLGEDRIVIDRECEETDGDRARFVDVLLQQSQSAIARLEAGSAAVDGPMRFVLERHTMTNIGPEFANPAPWPLPTPAYQLAVRWQEVKEFRKSQKSIVAEGEDARLLRELQERDRQGEFGRAYGFIPVEQDTWFYYLYLRDTIPLEDEDGLWQAIP